MKKDIEQLRSEKESLEKRASELYNKASEIGYRILAMTESKTKKYFDKYLKLESNGYFKYIHVLKASNTCGEWHLDGPGFTTYINDSTGKRYFCEDTVHNFVNIKDIEDNERWVVNIITKEEFSTDRSKYINELLNEEY